MIVSARKDVPVVVLWETSLLVRVGRVDLGRPLRGFVTDLLGNPAYRVYDLDAEQLFLADEAKPNDDAFDALVCAAARALGLPLVTRPGGSGLVSGPKHLVSRRDCSACATPSE